MHYVRTLGKGFEQCVQHRIRHRENAVVGAEVPRESLYSVQALRALCEVIHARAHLLEAELHPVG